MARGKTVTPQIIIGEQGIALITRRCLEMGYLFHPRRVDHGIDGHIDLVDPRSKVLLNLTLLVQSKAQNLPFPSETADGFHYICDERDLDLWLAGNAPVLPIFSHPETDEAWWVEVKSAFPDPVSRATRTVHVNKRAQAFDRDAAPAVLNLAQPKSAGMYLRPPPITEKLTTNLLPVIEMPSKFYTAPTTAKDYPAAGALLAAQGKRASGWILRDGLVVSFADLRQSPLNVLCQGEIEERDTKSWAESDDRDILFRFMDLLTRTVQESYSELRWHNERRHVHFRPTGRLGPRKAGKGPGSRGRTVFGPHQAKSDPTRVSYYHHAALRMRFRRVDGLWYCQLEPDYCFTSDGYNESRHADSLLAGIKRLERHAAVSGWVRMWANHLCRDPDLFSPPRPVRLEQLATVTVSGGIDDRWWGPAPTDSMRDEETEEAREETSVAEATLASADIDTADLLSLLNDEPDATAAPNPIHDAIDQTDDARGRDAREAEAKGEDAMRAEILDEPELEFGGGGRHVDPRFGILNYGPADLTASDSPQAIRVGLVGPADQLPELRAWLERCREVIPEKDERYPHLFPPFPGCDIDVGLRTTLVFSDRNSRTISDRDLRAIGKVGSPQGLLTAVEAYAAEIAALSDENRVDVLLVARPQQLTDTVPRSARGRVRTTGSPAEPDAGVQAESSKSDLPQFANFHDMLKARLLTLRQPIQIIRRSTWDEATPLPQGHSREDEATRAWNLHVALYYKAGGVPWRLQRNPTDLSSCYVGVAFYRNSERDTLDTSVAQVFNERGDGVIVRGGPARVTGDDKQPHLDRDDAHALLVSALDAYRHEHHTEPARVALHKTSSFTADEVEGFEGAASDRRLDTLELTWITNSEGVRLYRTGVAPPLRGTLLLLNEGELALYTKGSVEFYSTYPGMYVPHPIGIRPVHLTRSPQVLGREILALTKMNWNQTRLDGRQPVTLHRCDEQEAKRRRLGAIPSRSGPRALGSAPVDSHRADVPAVHEGGVPSPYAACPRSLDLPGDACGVQAEPGHLDRDAEFGDYGLGPHPARHGPQEKGPGQEERATQVGGLLLLVSTTGAERDAGDLPDLREVVLEEQVG